MFFSVALAHLQGPWPPTSWTRRSGAVRLAGAVRRRRGWDGGRRGVRRACDDRAEWLDGGWMDTGWAGGACMVSKCLTRPCAGRNTLQATRCYEPYKRDCEKHLQKGTFVLGLHSRHSRAAYICPAGGKISIIQSQVSPVSFLYFFLYFYFFIFSFISLCVASCSASSKVTTQRGGSAAPRVVLTVVGPALRDGKLPGLCLRSASGRRWRGDG